MLMQAKLTDSRDIEVARPVRQDCRFCGKTLEHLVLDLGMSPLSENFLTAAQAATAETFYPLQLFFCDRCYLVQLEEHVSGEEIFGGEYAYFSSFSTTWLEHARNYVEKIVPRLGLNGQSKVVEVASNDGYLLRNFVAHGIPCLGVEPSTNVGDAARAIGVPTVSRFFGRDTAHWLVEQGHAADLMTAINVLAHVPDLNDFVAGIKILLKPHGTMTIEFPLLMNMIEGNQFDTIYQEHYCYFSVLALENVFAAHGLKIYDVDQLPTHGGSLRIYLRHSENKAVPVTPAVHRIRDLEILKGYDKPETYLAFAEGVARTKHRLLEFLIEAKRCGKSMAAYGAPGKGNTLLNYCGIRQDFLDYAVDRNPYKHGRYLAGTHIPVFAPDKLEATRPDYIVILPWNLRDEIAAQLEYVRDWGAKFVVPIPELDVW